MSILIYCERVPTDFISKHKLLKNQIKQAFSGKQVRYEKIGYRDSNFINRTNADLYVHYFPGNSMQGFIAFPAKGERQVDSGIWWVKNDELCYKWDHWSKRVNCMNIYYFHRSYFLFSSRGEVYAGKKYLHFPFEGDLYTVISDKQFIEISPSVDFSIKLH